MLLTLYIFFYRIFLCDSASTYLSGYLIKEGMFQNIHNLHLFGSAQQMLEYLPNIRHYDMPSIIWLSLKKSNLCPSGAYNIAGEIKYLYKFHI